MRAVQDWAMSLGRAQLAMVGPPTSRPFRHRPHPTSLREATFSRRAGEGIRRPLQVSPATRLGTSSGLKPEWRSQRMSLSKNARKSGMPYFSMAMRSMPMPQAKPW